MLRSWLVRSRLDPDPGQACQWAWQVTATENCVALLPDCWADVGQAGPALNLLCVATPSQQQFTGTSTSSGCPIYPGLICKESRHVFSAVLSGYKKQFIQRRSHGTEGQILHKTREFVATPTPPLSSAWPVQFVFRVFLKQRSELALLVFWWYQNSKTWRLFFSPFCYARDRLVDVD